MNAFEVDCFGEEINKFFPTIYCSFPQKNDLFWRLFLRYFIHGLYNVSQCVFKKTGFDIAWKLSFWTDHFFIFMNERLLVLEKRWTVKFTLFFSYLIPSLRTLNDWITILPKFLALKTIKLIVVLSQLKMKFWKAACYQRFFKWLILLIKNMLWQRLINFCPLIE